jgi:hypothetical protein
LNITVQSYMDDLDFGLIACRAAVPDIQKMAELLVEGFETLKQAAGKKPPACARRTVKIKVAGADAEPAEKIAK